jgi:ArsR family transcriptional regulator, arsenate/arsenite/antimonite-responsive transcriptional repressor / arsenate reductase (thioredoxin)
MSPVQQIERVRVHAALGDEHRLAMVDALVAGDRTPGDLAQELGIASNLFAHHVGVLEEAGLIERRVSEGDHRRRYLVLRHDTLARVGIVFGGVSGRVVFVCTHNSARSQYAAAAYNLITGERASSAGTHPAASVHPLAIQAAGERGVDLAGAEPSGYEGLDEPFDMVVSVCDRAAEDAVPAGRRHLHWSVPDPVAVGDLPAFRRAFDELDRRLAMLAGVEGRVT